MGSKSSPSVPVCSHRPDAIHKGFANLDVTSLDELAKD